MTPSRVPSLILPLLLVALVTALSGARSGRAEPLTAGKRYTGKAAVEVPELELGFEVPAGFTGALPPGSQWFHVGKDNEEGRVFLYAERTSKAQMKALMSQPFPVADLVMLTPASAVREEGGALVADYTASDGQTRYPAQTRVVTGKSGVSVALVAVAPSARLSTYVALAQRIATSLRFDARAPSGGGVGGGPWAAKLANQRVVKFHHGSGYSERTEFLLCADGSFVRRFNASSTSVNGSGVMQDADRGRWSVHGDVLTLTYRGKETVTVRLEDRGGQLFVDGERWLREPARCH